MGFKFNTIPSTISGSLTNFRFYRELIRRPVREAFIYLAILVVIPVILFTGIQIYELNKIMGQFTEALKGNLPPLRIEKGQVIMDDGENFGFEKENEYTVDDLRQPLDRFNKWSGRAVQSKDNEKNLTPEEKERMVALEAAQQNTASALTWIDAHFPVPEALITSGEVDKLLEEDPPADEDTAKILRDTAHSRNFVFIVDLTTEDPPLPPGLLVFALSKNSLITNNPLAPKIPFSEDTSTVINDEMLQSWRKSIIWQMVPIMIGLGFVVTYLVTLIIILGGSAAAGVTASLLKWRLPFKQVFAIGLYAITPALLFILLCLILMISTPLLISLKLLLIIFLLLYGVYVISATKRCCSAD